MPPGCDRRAVRFSVTLRARVDTACSAAERLRVCPSPPGCGWPQRLGAAAAAAAVAIAAVLVVQDIRSGSRGPPRHGQFALPTTPGSYIGLYPANVPALVYRGDGVHERNRGHTTCDHVLQRLAGAVPDQTSPQPRPSTAQYRSFRSTQPASVCAAIAVGKYDTYLNGYAKAVRAYNHPVILSFGHEMNGDWYSWGYRHASPANFVAAWRHIVTLFRKRRVGNVTWLWTVNVSTRNTSSVSRSLVARQLVCDLGRD